MKTKNHNGFLKKEIILSEKQERSLISLLEEDCNDDIKLPFLLIKKFL